MKKKWEVNVNGVNNVIEYTGRKVLVNGQKYKVKSMNWFINLVDFPITIDGTEIHVVAIGSKVDIAINGIYQKTGDAYQPLKNVPAMNNVFIGISCFAGYFLCGIIGLAIGVAASFVYAKKGLEGKQKVVIGTFIGCSVIQVLIFAFVLLLQLAM